MLTSISNCNKCNLYKNQQPLLQRLTKPKYQTMIIGLSAVKIDGNIDDYQPLGSDTKSGNLIRQAFTDNENSEIYYTNLVKCLPLSNDKIRYPNQNEMEPCLNNLLYEIEVINPNKIILLGKKVSSFIAKQMNIILEKRSSNLNYSLGYHENVNIMEVYHPSYVSIYKRKYIEEYNKLLSMFVNGLID